LSQAKAISPALPASLARKVMTRLSALALASAPTLLGFAGAGFVSVGCGASGSETGAPATASSAEASMKTGTQATDFAARDIDGKTVRLSDYLGKQAVLIDFWSTYCEPCLAEMPHLRKLYAEQKAKGFVVLAISMDGPETVAEVPSFAKRNNMSFPVLLDEDSHIVSIYNPKKSAPLSVLIDKKGFVVRVREGYNPGDEGLIAADVATVLSSGASSSAPSGTSGAAGAGQSGGDVPATTK
jgi:peroxiredoxin